MTPKEKSLQLFVKFMELTPAEEEYELPYAKKCAIACCQEVIEQAEITDKMYKSTVWYMMDKEEGDPDKHLAVPYWKQVIEAINAL